MTKTKITVLSMLAAVAAVVTACTIALSQVPSAKLAWSAPTTNIDGTDVIGPLTYNVYQGPKGAEATTPVSTGITSTTVTITSNLTPGTTVCFEVTAVSGAGIESAKSNEACKAFAPEVPLAPTSLNVTYNLERLAGWSLSENFNS